jgi:pantetheine-phosphate adenylyltransferase
MTNKVGLLGGTFDVTHDGHAALLNTAFREASYVLIGVTSDQRAEEARERSVRPYWERIEELHAEAEVFANIYDCHYSTTEIDNGIDLAANESKADFIVVSPEAKTHERAQAVNEARVANDYDRLQIIEAPMVTDYKGRKISSTNVVEGEIDRHGNKVE